MVRKPLEKGKRQPPRFVVYYRSLNAVTSGDGYPIPSVSVILGTNDEGKLFAMLDLAGGFGKFLSILHTYIKLHLLRT